MTAATRALFNWGWIGGVNEGDQKQKRKRVRKKKLEQAEKIVVAVVVLLVFRVERSRKKKDKRQAARNQSPSEALFPQAHAFLLRGLDEGHVDALELESGGHG